VHDESLLAPYLLEQRLHAVDHPRLAPFMGRRAFGGSFPPLEDGSDENV
jgi:hypothetical protein